MDPTNASREGGIISLDVRERQSDLGLALAWHAYLSRGACGVQAGATEESCCKSESNFSVEPHMSLDRGLLLFCSAYIFQ